MLPLHYVVLETFCHSSEEPDAVRRCLLSAAGADDPALVQTSEVTGGTGNPMLVMRIKLVKASAFRAHLERIAGGKAGPEAEPGSLMIRLGKETSRRLDGELNFYFRLAKQPLLTDVPILVNGTVEGDVVIVRWKIRAYPPTSANGLAALRELLSL